MAGRGPYRLTLTGSPQKATQGNQSTVSGMAFVFVCYDADWTVGYSDMTAAAGATPGALVKAGAPLSVSVDVDSDALFACTADGTSGAVLHRVPAGI